MPVVDGGQLQISRSEVSLNRGSASFEETLQIIWFGSACHELRLGDLSIVTDPFVTNGTIIGSVKSDPERVGETLGKLKPPAVVLVNHSHSDHLVDAHEAMTSPSWKDRKVPLWGGATCKNILAGWKDIDDRCHPVPGSGSTFIDWNSDRPDMPEGYKLKVTAYAGVHSPHIGCSTVLFDGKVDAPLPEPPKTVGDYKLGEVFNYLVEMSNERTTFKVFLLGGPGQGSVLPGDVAPVDVVILPSPGAEKIPGYPQDHLAKLRPRHIIINHFNNFFADDRKKDEADGRKKDDPETQASLLRLDLAKLQYLSRKIQESVAAKDGPNGNFECLHIPAISVMKDDGGARNVILIDPSRPLTSASGTRD